MAPVPPEMTKPVTLTICLTALLALFTVTEAIFDPVSITLGVGAASIIGLKLVALKAGLVGGYVGSRLRLKPKKRLRFGKYRIGRSVGETAEDQDENMIQVMILKASLEDSQDCAKKLVSAYYSSDDLDVLSS